MNMDIRLATGFWQHPKVKKLEKRLGLKGVRSLQILWCWCAQNRPNGLLTGMDSEDIELAADWHGKAGAFFEQCMGVWIEELDGVYVLHEWEEHNPWQVANGELAQAAAEARREKARKAAQARWNKEKMADAVCSEDADAIPEQCSEDAQNMLGECSSNAQAMPSLTLTKTKELKGNLNTPPLAPQGGPDGGAKNPPSVSPPENPEPHEPDMEFAELRADWNEHMRAEGPRAGFKAYLSLKKARAWPGLGVIRHDIMRRKQAGVWNPGYEPSLERYLSERTWEAPLPAPRASPAAGARQGEPAAPTEYQKNMQDRRLMAMMVLERRRAKEKAAQGENDGAIDTQGTGIGIIAGIDADSARLPDRPHPGGTGIAC